MPIYADKASGCWRFTFNRIIAGKRHRTTKMLPKGWTKTQAHTYDQEETRRLTDLAAGIRQERARATIESAVEIYCNERLPQLKHGKKQLGDFALIFWAYEGRYLDELADVAREYIAKESGNLSPATIRNRLAYLRAACRYAFKAHGLCAHDPAERMQMPIVRNERHFYLERKTMLRIAKQLKGKYRAVIRIAFYSGMRLSEILNCTLSDGRMVAEDTKNGDRRIIPMHNKIRSCAKYIPLKIPKRTIQGQFQAARKELGLEHIHIHDLRHSAASEMINNGVDLYTVGAVLGHKSVVSTKRYSHLATDTLADAVAKIGRKIHDKR